VAPRPVFRQRPPVDKPEPDAPARHVATPAEREAGRAGVTERPPRPTAPPATSTDAPNSTRRGRRPGSSSRQESRTAAAKRVVDGGERPENVAAELGVDKRSVQMWAKTYRENRPAPSPSVPLDLVPLETGALVQSDPEPVNGFSFGAATNAQVN
jgi:hypothetical protein